MTAIATLRDSQVRRKVGLLGAGYICDVHAQVLKNISGVELVAVCDRAYGQAQAAARKYAIASVHTTLDELLAADVDTVHVLLPPDLHFDAARRILESGRHVLLEKPMALTAAECESLADLAASRNLQLSVNHNFLFLSSYEKLRQDLRERMLGNPSLISINWLFPLPLVQTGPFDNWMLRRPGNLFLELAPHVFAFVIDLTGPLDSLQVEVSRPRDLPGGARVYRVWRVHGVKNNTAVEIVVSVMPSCSDRSVTVYADAAVAKCDYSRNIYFRDEPGPYGLVINNLSTVLATARQTAASAMCNFGRAVVNTLQKKPAANPFGESIERSLRAFYSADAQTTDARLSPAFGVEVIRACERVIAAAPIESAESLEAFTGEPKAPPTVMVVGGTGFIGRYLVRALVDRGYGVRVLTRNHSAGRIAMTGMPVHLAAGDIADPAFLDHAMTGIKIVYHLAKAAGRTWDDYYRGDVLVTRAIAERALAAGVERFIYTGTIDSYYSGDASCVITADTPLDPQIAKRNFYGRSKAACETLLTQMHRDSGLPLVIFRPGIVIGRGCPPSHWGVGAFQSDTRMSFWGDGRHKLPFVLVEDVADALARAVDANGVVGERFLLTDEPLLSGQDYIKAVSNAAGVRIRAEGNPAWRSYVADLVKETAKHLIRHPNRRIPSFRDWKSRSHRARYDSTKAKEVLGWRPAGTREALIERGIVMPTRDYMS